MKISRIVFFAAVIALLSANCGVKGPPLPPEEVTAQPSPQPTPSPSPSKSATKGSGINNSEKRKKSQ